MQFVVSSLVALLIQTLASAPPAVQRVDVVGRMSVESVPPGGTVVLWADVTPKRNIHVYAPGAKGFEAVALIVSRKAGLAFGKPKYPAGELLASPGVDQRVPVYVKTFRMTQPLTLDRTVKSQTILTIAGAVNYQACDDRLCYPTASIPVNWTIKVR